MFVPGSQERRLQKVKELPADVIVCDLEDAVAPGEKQNARSLVRAAIEQNPERVNVVRVNDADSPYFLDDVAGVVSGRLHAIMLPKASKVEDILAAEAEIAKLEVKHRLPAGSVRIVPLIENAMGLHFAYEIAKASARVERFAFGSVDFTLDVNAELTRDGTEILFARSQLVVQSRAAALFCYRM